MHKKAQKVIAAISGGVDSSVTALLLKTQGYEVHGVYMKNWDEKDETGTCNGEADAEDAEWVCKKIGIPFHQINFIKEYWNNVFSNLVNDYTAGLTPNPDILCNKYIKFDSFYNAVLHNYGTNVIATGHYARSSFGDMLQNQKYKEGVHLLLAKDCVKDQTFFLSQISQEVLQKTMFPIGNLTKQEVKNIAQDKGLSRIAKKKESMGMCFIGNRNFQSFISQYISPNPGNFLDIETGEIVGQHDGIHNWTIGQRCRISGLKNPYYIVKKYPITQTILVARGTNHPALYTQIFVTDTPHWIHPSTEDILKDDVLNCSFRFQNTHKLTTCRVAKTSSQGLIIQLDNFLRAITPGQFAVLYKDGVCLGSARILQLGASLYELGINMDAAPIIHDKKMKFVVKH